MLNSELGVGGARVERDPLVDFRRLQQTRPASIVSDGSSLRWRFGERLDDVLEEACRRFADRTAVATEGAELSFRELDQRASQMARFFRARGVKAGDRVGVLLDRGFETYVALFALLKAGAAYVPLDPNHPAERVRYILADAGATLAVAHARLSDRLAGVGVETLVLDGAREQIAGFADGPLADAERDGRGEGLCYVLYTSGTTGNPKGVAIAHPSICNFVRVAAESYGFLPGDRVYQGMSIAFDFSVEEVWVPLVAGATLVPNTSATSLFGEELADFLEQRDVTCFACVPTLLASIDRDLPKLRVFLIGGEACPPALVRRWSRPGRTLLNSYGPTETTVTATLGTLDPDRPVTIGKPLPTYSIVILDPDEDVPVELGEQGEIGIAGVGVAEGYLNRPELTQQKFIRDMLALPNNPSGRIYRSGDLGRITEDGEIEYLGRIDTQIKLRGYRIELTEIESVLIELPEIAQAVAATFEPEPGAPELVAYYAVKHGAAAPDPAAIVAHMRARLPAYMTPSYLERLPFIPTLVSNKADRKLLPAPKSPRLRLTGSVVPPETETEADLCEALKGVLGLEAVSIDADIFVEYGAHSLLMARFCARVRALDPSLHIAMRDVYANTTIRRLARALEAAKPAPAENLEVEPAHRPSNFAYYACGAAQAAFYVVVGAIAIAAGQAAFGWIYEAVDAPLTLYGRALTVAIVWFVGHNGLAVAAKWLLLGRVRAGAIPIWSARYFRFWIVKRLARSAPATVFAGTPLFNFYLRLLGAKIGRNAAILTHSAPFASADLFEVGEDALVMRSVTLPGYSAYGNRLHLDAIRLGRNAFVGEQSLMDIGSSIGDFGELGHASSLQRGERVPDGKRYAGSPAEETAARFRLADDAPARPLHRTLFTAARLAFVIAVAGALTETVVVYLMNALTEGDDALALKPLDAIFAILPLAAATALAVTLGGLVAWLLAIYIVPRIANMFLVEGKVYPLYGFHHGMQQLVGLLSNSQFFSLMFGDSVFIKPYLRWVGWTVGGGEETGSNFGAQQGQDNPFLCSVGEDTVASDGLWLGNLVMSSRAFRLGRSRLGDRNFCGTNVYAPPDVRTGDNVMFATKVMAPVDGPVRENVGLLGSPAFEIPRASQRDLDMLAGIGAKERKRRLVRKTWINVVAMIGLVASRALIVFLTVFVFGWTAAVYGVNDVTAMTAAAGVFFLLSAAAMVFIERASLGFRRLKPTMATVYDPAFWRVERYWKLMIPLHGAFAGTPMRNVVMRLLGAKVGRRVFDDGCSVSERTLVVVGDEANLNENALLQAHSLEEGVFKSDYVRIGAGASVGARCIVHYGVTVGEGTHLDPDAFLMKGEITPARSRWRGNPAKLVG